MVLYVLNSGSTGNCYLLKSKRGKCLIIEAGVKYPKILQGINYELDSVAGCLITHKHTDHSLSVDNLLAAGIDVYANLDTLNNSTLGGASIFAHQIEPKRVYHIDEFTVLPFAARHDVPCLCFLIKHSEMGSLFFMTDSCEAPLIQFTHLEHLMIEANYSSRLIEPALDGGAKTIAGMRRVIKAHLSIEQAVAAIKQLTLHPEQLHEIVLLHTSITTGDCKAFIKTVEGVYGIPTYAAALKQYHKITLSK